MIELEHWGLIDYREACERQEQYVREIQKGQRLSTLVFCQHPTVVSVGRAADRRNILSSESELRANGIEMVDNNRGGDVTIHNPGQLVGYPIFHLSAFKEDLHWFLREIEECIILTVKSFDIEASRIAGLTGVWVDESRKICAIGVHCSRWVCSHGFALNVNNDLGDFDHIVPCGILDKKVSSLTQELGKNVDIGDVEKICKTIFQQRF